MPWTKTYQGEFTVTDIGAVGVARTGVQDGDQIAVSYVCQATVNTPDGLKEITVKISEQKYNRIIRALARPILRRAKKDHPAMTADITGTDAN